MRIHHLALRTRDVERLERFYAGLLALSVVRRDGARSVWLDAGGTVIMIEHAASDEPVVPAGSLELVAFAVEDKESWRQKLAAAAVGVEGETGYTLYFRDPDGRRIGVSSYPFGEKRQEEGIARDAKGKSG